MNPNVKKISNVFASEMKITEASSKMSSKKTALLKWFNVSVKNPRGKPLLKQSLEYVLENRCS